MSTRVKQEKTFLWWGLVVVGVVAVVSLTKSIVDLLGQKEKLTEAKLRVEKLEAENITLEKEYRYKTSPYYLEEVVREKLNLGRPGEMVVVIPEEQVTEAATAAAGGALELKNGDETQGNWPIWRKWLGVFF